MIETSEADSVSAAGRSMDARFRLSLLAVTAAGAAWRLGYLFVVKADQKLLLNDSLYYSIQALSLIHI